MRSKAKFDLRLGNCLEVLKEFPDNFFDSIITDPPYGISFMGRKWDYSIPDVSIWSECYRVLKQGGNLLSFAGTRTQHRMVANIVGAGYELQDVTLMCYGSGFPKSLNVEKAVQKIAPEQASRFQGLHTALKPAHEPISLFTKGGSLTLHADFKRLYYCAKASKRERNMGLGADTVNAHPTVKPLKLMESLCELATPPGGTILDPFMGSGTTGIAALNLGFNFVGIEMGEDYFDIAQTRLNTLHGDPQQ